MINRQPGYKAARNDWKVLKPRLNKEGSQSVTDCNRLKVPAADGKSYAVKREADHAIRANIIHRERPAIHEITPRSNAGATAVE